MKPAIYKGTANCVGTVGDFIDALNPQSWKDHAPMIWRASYLIVTDPDGSTLQKGPVLSLAKSALSDVRSDPPGQDKTRTPVTGWGPPGDGLFFEQVLFSESIYRNVLGTRFVSNLPGTPDFDANRPASFRFDYWQYDCLDTASPDSEQPINGGVDVDFGYSQCVANADGATVDIELAKSVRFSQPAAILGDVNRLARVLVPLVFDSVLFELKFNAAGGKING